jgi:hypothetical protein
MATRRDDPRPARGDDARDERRPQRPPKGNVARRLRQNLKRTVRERQLDRQFLRWAS